METTITQVSPVEYQLEIRAGKDVLEPRIEKALRQRRQHVTLKGFRPGHVPLSVVRKLHGRAISYEVVDDLIQTTYNDAVLKSAEHDVLGSPTITKLEYEPNGDLTAAVQFGVRPVIELKDLSKERLTKMTHAVAEKEVDDEINRLRSSRATFTPREGAAQEEDFVRVDLQRLDPETDTAIIGDRQEGVTFFLGGELDPDAKKALTGASRGDSIRFYLPMPDSDEKHRYQAHVTDVQTRELPVMDDAFASTLTDGQIETVEELRADVAKRLQEQWDQLLRDRLESAAISRLIELHPFEVPHGVVHVYLDSMLEDVKQRNKGKFPEGFDAHAFHHDRHDDAEEMARWMLIRDKITEENAITVENTDLDEAFTRSDDPNAQPGESIRKMFEQHYPDMIEQMKRRIENRKVFDWIFSQFEIVTEEWQDDRTE